MPNLDVANATLYYETLGTGPLLLCISGANGSCDIWKPLSMQLRKHFTICSYDRRGFSRSVLTGAQDYDHRLQTDADDAAALIQHLSGDDEPATVLGNSSGAVVGLELLIRHPETVRNLLCHEPPLASLLEDCETIRIEHREIYNLYRKQGIAPAALRFAESIKAGPETQGLLRSMDPKAGPYNFANSMYWFERELGIYAVSTLDMEALRKESRKLILINGEDSDPEALQYRPNVKMAGMFGGEVQIVPGGHVGFALKAKAFAEGIYALLREVDSSY
ncbi:hypothetical protein D0866_03133 [Hortaea werneckii]|uniref:AB hydrolase-1 domain-containing protein n=1 Tax=Hortaea werneckii TaxID=91943 RepID=A0A3M7BCX5_HORWE|nr:hypothetical protein D0866_03133 [Hortaea werneckii]